MSLDHGIEAMDDELITSPPSRPDTPPNRWQKERGWNPLTPWINPKARFHANGKYATGIYKKWLEENK